MKITVPDMHCKNCAAKIEKQLFISGIEAQITLEQKSVEVKDQDLEQAIDSIKKAGYSPET